MPNRNGTGPAGQGPLTGRGLGPCGRGLRLGLGRGLGRFFCWRQPETKEEKLQALTNYKDALKQELEEVAKEEENLK